jgi:hypothetical protein
MDDVSFVDHGNCMDFRPAQKYHHVFDPNPGANAVKLFLRKP